VIRLYEEIGNVIETHEHKGDFKEWQCVVRITSHTLSMETFSACRRRNPLLYPAELRAQNLQGLIPRFAANKSARPYGILISAFSK
jgi:hypothetical protein